MIEFAFSAQGGAAAPCLFALTGVAGSDSALAPAAFRMELGASAAGAVRAELLAQLTGLSGGESESAVTRGALAQALWGLCGKPGADSAGDDALGAQTWAEAQGLILGDGSAVRAGEPLTREATAVILYRYARLLGGDIAPVGDLSAWSDGEQVSDWAAEAVIWALNAGILTAEAAGELHPAGAATCREVADMLAALLEDCLPSI